jgi:acyl-CoA thioester hydrolase
MDRPDTTPLLTFEHRMRCRYSETDQMGYVYYGRYLEFFEVARTEMIRSLGLPYAEMERQGVMLPVTHARVDYLKPLIYDEEFVVRVTIHEVPAVRLKTHYEVLGAEGLSATGYVELCFLDRQSRRPVRAPGTILDAFDGR